MNSHLQKTQSWLLGLLLIALSLSQPAFANESDITTDKATREAYLQAIPAMPESDRPKFIHGRSLVRQVWVIAPSENREIAGLGPLYNRLSCIACHIGNGRGFAPATPQEPMRTMLVRLSVPGDDGHGGPKPHAAYGGQLNENGVPGVTGEGRAEVRFTEHAVKLKDGTQIKLRKPVITFVDLAYGEFPPEMMTSPRITPPLFGLGLLQAVPEADIVALVDAPKPEGIKGRVNRVWDEEQQKNVLGRFGWKANMPNLRQQIAGAYVGDMGITSPLFPKENCTAAQGACRQSPSAGSPELTKEQLDASEFYHFALAAPRQRNANNKQVQRGAALFRQAQCSACHVPQLKTGDFAPLPALSHQIIRPYTDLLLHDMGEALADHRPDYLATGREWRTPPLWGIGLARKVDPRAGFLHDGRARTVLEAVLWHDGEAANAAQSVKDMSASDRKALTKFLESL
ncbi:MAG: c-type cytochrome [Gammaproteobacteria bacterium]|nr:c-type cytochrome [Gammaproteobacteria bacterium]MBU1482887.1 c-type cytochrome [Gammaproteobacteria bacterium]